MLALIISAVIGIAQALPNLIVGIEAAFGGKPKQGAAKWIAVETALSKPISYIAETVAKTVPNAKVDLVATEVAKLTKAFNDGVVAFYNSVGWPTSEATLVIPAPIVPPTTPTT